MRHEIRTDMFYLPLCFTHYFPSPSLTLSLSLSLSPSHSFIFSLSRSLSLSLFLSLFLCSSLSFSISLCFYPSLLSVFMELANCKIVSCCRLSRIVPKLLFSVVPMTSVSFPRGTQERMSGPAVWPDVVKAPMGETVQGWDSDALNVHPGSRPHGWCKGWSTIYARALSIVGRVEGAFATRAMKVLGAMARWIPELLVPRGALGTAWLGCPVEVFSAMALREDHGRYHGLSRAPSGMLCARLGFVHSTQSRRKDLTPKADRLHL